MRESVAGFTSTGSKRPEALFGGRADGVPSAMVRSAGCRVWDAEGREYLDLVMALGAVALGYGHPAVTEAAVRAVRDGVVGPLAPVLEEEVAAELARRIPWVEQTRFLKSGAEAMAQVLDTAKRLCNRCEQMRNKCLAIRASRSRGPNGASQSASASPSRPKVLVNSTLE